MSDNVANIYERSIIRYCMVLDHPKIRKTVIFAEHFDTVFAELEAAYPDRAEWATTWADDPMLAIQALCPFQARPLFRARDFNDLFRSLASVDTVTKRMHIEVSESTTTSCSFGFNVSGDGAALFEEGIDGCVAELWEYENSVADARFIASGTVSGGGIEGSLVQISVPVVDRTDEYSGEFDDFFVVPGDTTSFRGSIGKKAPLVYGTILGLSILSWNVGAIGRLRDAITDTATNIYILIDDFSFLGDPVADGYFSLVIDGEVLAMATYEGVIGSVYENPTTHYYTCFARGSQRTEHDAGAEVRHLVPEYISYVIAQNKISSAVRLRFVDSSGGIFLPTETFDFYLDLTASESQPSAYCEFNRETRETTVEFTGDVESSEGTITINPSDWVISDVQFTNEGTSFSRQLYESHAPPTLPDWTALNVNDEWNNNEKFYIGCSAVDAVTAGNAQTVYELSLASNVLPGVAVDGDQFRITVHTQPNPATVPSIYDDTAHSFSAVNRYIIAKNQAGNDVTVAGNVVGEMRIWVGDPYGWYWYSLDRGRLNELKIRIAVRPDYFPPEKAVTVVAWIASASYIFQAASLVEDLDNITDGNSSTFANLIARPGETSTRLVAFNVPIGDMPFVQDRVVRAVTLKIKYKLVIDAGSSVTARFYYGGNKISNQIALTNNTDPAAEVEHDIYLISDDGYMPDDFTDDSYVRFTISTVDGADVFELYYVKIWIETTKTGSVGYFYSNQALLDVSGPTDSAALTGLDDGEITGTTDQLIDNPADVVKTILLVDSGLSSSRIDERSFVVSRNYYNRLTESFTPNAPATGAGYGYVTYGSETWTANEWAGYILGASNGTNRYLVKSNNATTLFLRDTSNNFGTAVYKMSGLWKLAGTSGNEYSLYSLLSQIQDSFMMRVGEDAVNGRQKFKCCYPLFGVNPRIQARLFGVGGEAHATLPSFKIKAGEYTYTRADDPIKKCNVRYGRQFYKGGTASIGAEDGWLGRQTSTNYILDRGRTVDLDAEWIRDPVTAKLLAECVIELYRSSPKIWAIPVPPDAINFCSWGTIVEVVGRGFVYGSDRGLEGKACMVVGYDYDPSHGGVLLVCDRAMWSYVEWDGYVEPVGGGGGE